MAKRYLVAPIDPGARIPDPDRPGALIPPFGTVLRESPQLAALVARGEVLATEIDPSVPPTLPPVDRDLDALTLTRAGLAREYTLASLLGLVDRFSEEDIAARVADLLDSPAGTLQTALAAIGAAVALKSPSVLALAGAGTILRPLAEYLHGGIYDPRNYGAIAGGRSGTSSAAVAADLLRAAANQAAFQACADEYADACAAGRSAAFLFPPGEYLILATKNTVGHWNGPVNMPGTDGWSNACVRFDGGGRSFFGGLVHGADCRLIRMEEDPCSNDNSPNALVRAKAAFNSYDSTIFVTRWSGMRHTGRVFSEGYGEAVRRRATSGAGWDLSYGVEHFTADWIGGFGGTNSAIVIGMNRRKGTLAAPELGYDVTAPCRYINIRAIEAFNGEHGVLVNIACGVRIGTLTIDTKTYKYRGVTQPRYMQRGLYILSAEVHVDRIDIVSGPEHVAIFIVVASQHRTAFDADVTIGIVNATANKGQNVDRHTLIDIYDTNSILSDGPGGIYRQFSLRISHIYARGYKRILMTRDDRRAGGYFDETRNACKGLRIDYIDGRATAQGLNVRLFGGSDGPIEFPAGAITVASDAAYSASARPGLGINIEGGCAMGMVAAEENPITLDQLAAELGPWRPSIMRCVVDWLDANGDPVKQTVIYDPVRAGVTGIEAWRPVRPTKAIQAANVGPVLVTSGNAPITISGVDALNLAMPVAVYADEGVPEAVSREIRLNAIRHPDTVRYRTGSGLAARQEYVDTYVPAPINRRDYRVVTYDFLPVPAGGQSSLVERNVGGVKRHDPIKVTALDDAGPCHFVGFAPADGVVRFRAVNGSGADFNLPPMPFAILSEGIMTEAA